MLLSHTFCLIPLEVQLSGGRAHTHTHTQNRNGRIPAHPNARIRPRDVSAHKHVEAGHREWGEGRTDTQMGGEGRARWGAGALLPLEPARVQRAGQPSGDVGLQPCRALPCLPPRRCAESSWAEGATHTERLAWN